MASTLLQRLPRAALVALVSSTVLGAALGTAFAAGEPDLPKTFAVPVVHEGDKMEYEVVLTGQVTNLTSGQTTPEDDRLAMVFEWLPERMAPDQDGVWRTVHPVARTLRLSANDPALAFSSEWLFDAATGDLSARRNAGTGQVSITMQGVFGLGGSRETTDYTTIQTSYDAAGGCGLRNDLQGATVDPRHQPLELRGCNDAEAGEASLFRAFEATTIDGVAALGYKSGDAKVWFAREVPVPVRIHVTHDITDSGHRYTGQTTILLVGFERGAAPYGKPSAPHGLPVQMALESADRLGPREAGFPVAFSLRDAWDQALGEHDRFASFVEQHPDAYVALANPGVDEVGDVRSWSFALTNGEALIYMDVEDREPTLLESLGLGGESSTAQTEAVFGFRFPPPDALPADLPTVASIGSAWRQFDPAGGEPTAWSLAIFCWPFDLDCEEPVVQVRAGQLATADAENSPLELVMGGNTTATAEYTGLVVDATGRVIAFEETEAHSRRQSTGIVPAGSPSGDAAVPVSQAPLASVSPWWTWPSPEAAAGAGILGLLVGLAYWIWPSIKSAPLFGLFSRLRKHQILEHPTRASIVAAVDAQPAIHQNALREKLGVSNSVMDHHLRILVANDILIRRKQAGRACYFPASTGRQDLDSLPWLKSPGARKVLAAVAQHPGRSGRDLAAATDLDPATVSHHVKRLRGAGLVDTRRVGRAIAVYATTSGSRVAAAA